MSTFPVPPTDLATRYDILFCHPGYKDGDKLLALPRVDRSGSITTFGVNYGTALVACQIATGNTFETGAFALDRNGNQPVNLQSDDVLTEDLYYFLVGGVSDPYPVVPSFRDWQFPHGRIPDIWPVITTSARTDDRCVITNVSFAIDKAHLVPQEELGWFQRNNMRKYERVIDGIDNPANLIPLRSDLHRCFDERWLAIVPKATASNTRHYVTHVLTASAAELWPTYHNAIVQHLDPMARPYLFARFAWAILLQVKSFVTDGESRNVIRVQSSQGKIEYKTEFLSGQQLMAAYSGGGDQEYLLAELRSKLEEVLPEAEDMSAEMESLA